MFETVNCRCREVMMPDMMQTSSAEDALPPTVLAARALLNQMDENELAHMFYAMLSKVRDHNIKNDAATQFVISFPKQAPFKTPVMSDDIRILKLGMLDGVRLDKLYEAEFRRLSPVPGTLK